MGYLDQVRASFTGAQNIKQISTPNKPAETANVNPASSNIQLSSANSNIDLSDTMAAISNKARVNSPEAQGLASATQIANGQLVNGYHFDKLDCNQELFALKYNTANVPRVAEGTVARCENIDYAHAATELKNSPFAELFS